MHHICLAAPPPPAAACRWASAACSWLAQLILHPPAHFSAHLRHSAPLPQAARKPPSQARVQGQRTCKMAFEDAWDEEKAR